MGFLDENAGGGGPPILKFNNEGKYVKRGSEEAFNDQHFVAYPRDARAGYIKFAGKGEKPERHLGAIFPKDETPTRASLGETDKSAWPKSKFGGEEPEDPWTPVIEIPLKHQETGEVFLFAAQSKTSIGAVKDLFAQLKKVPEGFDPVISLGVGTMQTRFGKRKKPVLSLVGQLPHVNGKDESPASDGSPPFDDDSGF